MAVEAWELAGEPGSVTRPHLEIAPPPPPRGRPLAAVSFVVLLVATLASPAVDAARQAPPRPTAWSFRHAPASQLEALDRFSSFPPGRRPTSTRPAGGIAFVSCTNLWTALPDGSRARKLLAFPGASSPAFSPDGKTLAFFGPTGEGAGLFMVAADGSGLTELGTFTDGRVPISARLSNLTWSDNGRKLAFALVDPAHGATTGGSTIWKLDLTTGEFARIADAPPSAGFVQGRLVYSERLHLGRDDGLSFRAQKPNGYITRRMSTDGDDLAFATVPGTFSDSWSARHGAVVLSRGAAGDIRLLVKRSAWTKGAKDSYAAPSPYRFHPYARLSLSQDGSRVTADLVDPKGDRAVGILDLVSGEWTVLDYAWSAGFTPAPTSTGPLAARRAARLAGDVFQSWGRGREYSAASILLAATDDDLIDGRRGGSVAGPPEKISGGWRVTGTIYRRDQRRYRFQEVRLDLTRQRADVLSGSLHAVSEPRRLETIDDAKAFVATLLGDDIAFRWPQLPAGAQLDRRWPVDAYSWDGTALATVHLRVPGEGERHRSLNVSYGNVSFSLGCGGENDPEEGQVGEEPALYDELGAGRDATRQVLWPATLETRDTAMYSVYGEMPRAEVERIAGSMSP